MNIWIPLIGDESLICQKEKGNEYDPDVVTITRNNVAAGCVPQNICDHFWKFLFLPKTSIRARSCVKESTMVQVMALKLLYILFFKAMSKE